MFIRWEYPLIMYQLRRDQNRSRIKSAGPGADYTQPSRTVVPSNTKTSRSVYAPRAIGSPSRQVQPKSRNCFFIHYQIPSAMNCRSAASATDSDARIPARVMSAFQPATFHSLERVDVPMKPRKPLDRRTARADFDSVPGLDHPEPPIKAEPSAVPDILLGEF
jgi:hypothetical protein